MKFGWCLLVVIFLWAADLHAERVNITVDARETGAAINPRLYGVFVEEINTGVDGGLYAELVRNRGFEDANAPEGFSLRDGKWVNPGGYATPYTFDVDKSLPYWTLLTDGGATGSMSLDLTNPLNATTPRSCRIDVADLTKGRVAVANEGYWGIGVKAGETYALSFWARCAEGFTGSVVATLEGAKGEVQSDAPTATGLTPTWRKFDVKLAANKTDPKARLVLAPDAKGTVWLDMVSLFPTKTFKDRPNGLRRDIAQLIADLKPGFVRFPGGCVVEGATLENAYDWKQSIGPIEARQEIWNVWDYRRTHGMGFHEYLQFCEDLGSEPMFVASAGQTCVFRRNTAPVAMKDLQPLADNFLDAVEYANGPADSKWGSLRAKAGHESSFGLKMLEIGNENVGPEYEDRYAAIYPQIKAKYPELLALACFGQRRAPTEMVDEHYYNAPNWFIHNAGLYDRRDRKAPPVYLAEVAVTSAEGGRDKGNLISALAEGVFLMGAERNGDVVRMASYAPLLANVNGRTPLAGAPPAWHGMIYFDSSRSFGTVSYYLWKLFANNLPTRNVRATAERENKVAAIGGRIGVGTWGTSAEFKDVRVEKDGKVLYAADFAGGSNGWTAESGRWAVEDGAYRQPATRNALSYIGDDGWSDYTLTLKARKLRGPEGFLIVFGKKGGDQFWWNVGGWGNSQHAIEFNQTPVGEPVAGKIETDRWYDVKVQLEGMRVRCYLDGKLIHDATAAAPEPLHVAAGTNERSGDLIVKVINTSADPMQSKVSLTGQPVAGRTAEITVLTARRPGENNSIDAPTHVVPVKGQLLDVDTSLSHEFPPHSLTIIRLVAAAKRDGDGPQSTTRPRSEVMTIDPPQDEFFAKQIGYDGIAIKSSAAVADEALLEARGRLEMMMKNLPNVRKNLAAAGAELHIIGKDEQPSDLPELRQYKGKPFDGDQTIDQRTRGVGGLMTSCGEENLLRLPKDRYRGRDICVHEWAHNIQGQGVTEDVRKQIEAQYKRSLDAGRWRGAYAASNVNEFFAELTMWYFGTHGDMGMQGPKPADGPDGLKAYDPEAFDLLDRFYGGKIDVALLPKNSR